MTLAEMRERKGMTQVEAAKAVGVTRRTWQRWEHGVTPMPSSRIFTVARILDVSPGEIVAALAEARARQARIVE